MKYFKVLFKYKFFLLLNFLVCYPSLSDNHNIYDTLELIKKDLKTLEKAIYKKSEGQHSPYKEILQKYEKKYPWFV